MDLFGTLSGIVAGVAFAPWNQKAQAQYLVTGATKGVSGVIETLNAGFGGVGGFAIKREEGLKRGVQGGIGVLPQLAGEEIQEGLQKAGQTASIGLLIGAGILALLILKGSD